MVFASPGDGALPGTVDGAVQVTGFIPGIDRVAVSGALAGDDFASLGAALGTLSNSTAGADVLVLATNGTSTGLYLVVDADGTGQPAATGIRLLGMFNNTVGIDASALTLG